MQAIFEDQETNATSAVYQVGSIASRKAHPGIAGETITVMAAGTFDGATVTLEAAPRAAGPWLAIPDGAFTAATVQLTALSRRVYLRAVVTSAGASTSLSVWAG